MCVCQMITFESFDVESSFLRIRYNLFGIQVEFVYEGHRVMVKVTGAKHVKKSLLPLCKTSSGNNSGPIKHRAVKFACIMYRFFKINLRLTHAQGFQLWQIEWCDLHLCHVTGSDYA